MNRPKHSIIVPAYNTGEAIRRCIDSVVAQTSADWELLVIDDGSKDSTPAIIDTYAQTDGRIQAFHVTNGGVARARNIGMEHANGEYVMFVDSDDWIEPDYLRQVEACMEDCSDIYMLGITIDHCDEAGKVCYSEIKGAPVHRRISSGEVLDNVGYLTRTMNMESSCLKSYRREFLLQHGIRFKEGMIVFEDFYFVLTCLCRRPSVTLIPFIGYHYMNGMQYDPVTRRGGRDLYPSVHALWGVLDELSAMLGVTSFSREVVLRTMAEKMNVVIGQASAGRTLAQRKNPFKQISKDEVLRKHRSEMLQYGGGRFRLQYYCASAGFPLVSYLLYRLLK